MAKSRRRIVGSRRSNTGEVVVGVEDDDLMITNLPSLPHELVMEILSWLPATNLWLLRFVSKTWFKLLTVDTQFANLNSDRSSFILNNKVGPSILALRRRVPYKLSFCLSTGYMACHKATQLKSPFDQDSVYYKIWGISNGLVCLSSSDKHEVYIWNPMTSDYIGVPYSPIQPHSLNPLCWRSDLFAFCFDQSTNEYKLVRIYNAICGQLDSHFQLSVYILGKGSSWRIVKEDLPSPRGPLKRNCQIVNGVLHWLAHRCPEPYPYVIVGFDLKDEVLRHILPPNEAEFDDRLGRNQIVELDGFLCLFTHSVGEPIQIWMMQEYGVVNSWTKQFIIGSPEICKTVHCIDPLGAHNGKIILMETGGLIIYNQKTKSSRKLKGFKYWVMEVYTYVGSIVSPSVISGDISEVRHIMK